MRAFGNSDAIRDAAADGEEGGAHRRELHRAGGGRLAHREGGEVHAGDDGGRHALERTFGERGRAVVPGDAGVEGDRGARRRGARGVRGQRDFRADRDQERERRWRGTSWSSAPGCGRTRCWPSGPGSRSTTGSSATRGWRARRRGSSPPGTAARASGVVHGRRIRIEHWDIAFQQGKHAARGMMGDKEPFPEIPYFFRDLADWASFEYVGPAEKWDEVVFRGDRDGGEFTAWYLEGGKVARRAGDGPLRGPHPRAPADRERGGRVGPRGRPGRRGFGARVDRCLRASRPAPGVRTPGSCPSWAQ